MTRRPIDPAEAQAGDVMTYVHPVVREVRSHRIQRRAEREMGRMVVVCRGGRPDVVAEKPKLRVAFLPELHPHEMGIADLLVWVPIEDVSSAETDQ